MDANLDSVTPTFSEGTRFHDLDIVRLTEDVHTKEGLFPTGASGTVVFVHEGAETYEVEFAEPHPDVVTLREDQLVDAWPN